MYLTGDGVPVNHVQAYAWCSLEANGGTLLHADADSCRVAAESELSYDVLDLAVEIHNGDY